MSVSPAVQAQFKKYPLHERRQLLAELEQAKATYERKIEPLREEVRVLAEEIDCLRRLLA